MTVKPRTRDEYIAAQWLAGFSIGYLADQLGVSLEEAESALHRYAAEVSPTLRLQRAKGGER